MSTTQLLEHSCNIVYLIQTNQGVAQKRLFKFDKYSNWNIQNRYGTGFFLK